MFNSMAMQILSYKNCNTPAVLSSDGIELSYKELCTLAMHNANKISTPSTNLLLYAINSAYFAVGLLAAWLCDKTVVLVNPKYSDEEILALKEFCNADLIIYPNEFERELGGKISSLHLENQFTDDNLYFKREYKNKLALILPTTGTTSNPKHVMLSPVAIMAVTAGLAHGVGSSRDLRELCYVPMHSVTGCVGQLLYMLSIGASLLMISGSISVEKLADAIESKKPNILVTTPTIFSLISKYKNAKNLLENMPRIILCGEKARPSDIMAWSKTYPNSAICQIYGATEAASAVTGGFESYRDIPADSVGKSILNQTVGILHDNQIFFGQNIEGEILISGPAIFEGYYRNEEATKRAMWGSWLRTGDVGRLDDLGRLFITGRLKNIIIVSGQNVHAENVEAAIALHPSITDVVAYGVPDQFSGEAVAVKVVVKQGTTVTKKELIDFCKNKLALYQMPKYVEIKDSLDVNPGGKVRRNYEKPFGSE